MGAREPVSGSARGWLWMVTLGVACVVLLLAARAGASAAGRWLSAAETPVPSDLLVVVAGGADERLVTAGALYRQGFAPRILMTDLPGIRGERAARLSREGVPPDRMLHCPSPVSSTQEDALCVREVVLREQARSVLVVTSPYHCRRLRLIFGRSLKGLPVRIAVVPSSSLYWPTDHWWRHREGWEVPAEIVKLGWAWATVPNRREVAPDGF